MKSSVVSIVVVSWNSAAVLPGLLETLADGMAGTDWQFVLADNASADDSVAVVRAALPDARIVQTGRNAGYAAAINAAVAEVRPEGPVLVLNPDIRLRPGFGKALLAGLEAEPGTGIAAPRLLGADGSVTPTLRREPSLPRAVGEAVLGNIRAGRFPCSARSSPTPTPTPARPGPTGRRARPCWSRRSARRPAGRGTSPSSSTRRRRSTNYGPVTGVSPPDWSPARWRSTWRASPRCPRGCGRWWCSTRCASTAAATAGCPPRCSGWRCWSARCPGAGWSATSAAASPLAHLCDPSGRWGTGVTVRQPGAPVLP
ncbi:glycosyltransferase [Streptacidiphilus monticola]